MNPSSSNPHLDEVIARLRKYGLDQADSAPSLTISGNHHPGGSEALKNWKMLPSYSTEIILRHSEVISFTVRLIPDFSRPTSQKSFIKAYQQSLNHIGELPLAVSSAMIRASELDSSDGTSPQLWKDALRIEIEGPSQLHLTLLDIPSLSGLIQSLPKIETGYQNSNAPSISEMSSFTSGSNTPTHTAISEGFSFPSPPPSRDTVPHAGKTFIIRSRSHGSVITLKDGLLQLTPDIPSAGGCHWTCVERDGWLGFRNWVSGQFFGHDGKGKFHCKVTHHRSNEWFCARAHPGGGHLLLMLHGDKFRQMKVGTEETELLEVDGEGTAWDFVEV